LMLLSSSTLPWTIKKAELLHLYRKFHYKFPASRTAETYAKGLKVISQNQLLPPSGTAIDRTRPTLPRLMQVQKVSSAACPLLGVIVPSKLYGDENPSVDIGGLFKSKSISLCQITASSLNRQHI
jgi:hypothetical protein